MQRRTLMLTPSLSRVCRQSALAHVEKDIEYKTFSKAARSAMIHRLRVAVEDVKRCANTTLPPMSAILFRGSYGYGDPAVYSDLDTVLLSAEIPLDSSDRVPRWPLSAGVEHSTTTYSIPDLTENFDRLVFWLSIPQLRFVCGERSTYCRFMEFVINVLRKTPSGSFLDMLRQEDFWKYSADSSSPHYYNLKRGLGAFIEHDFVRLAVYQKRVRGEEMGSEAVRHIHILFRHYLYLTRLKEFLHRTHLSPREVRPRPTGGGASAPWFFAPDIIEAIAREQQQHFEQFLGLKNSQASVGNGSTCTQGRPVSFQDRTDYAFWSYAHIDDDCGKLISLCERLRLEVQRRTARPFRIYVDRQELRVGRYWREDLEDALDRSDLLFVVMTPSYFSSEACRKEYEVFRDKERYSGSLNLILSLFTTSQRTSSRRRRQQAKMNGLPISRLGNTWIGGNSG
jgi:hypothetical protein